VRKQILEQMRTGLTKAGSFKQYILSPERYTTIIPEGLSDYIAGPIMCSASTAYTSIKESGLRPGQWAVFPGGGGGVGIQAVQLAVAMGLRAVVVDTGAERRELCKKFGAEHFVDFKEVTDTCTEVVKLTKGGAHAVFVTGTLQFHICVWFGADDASCAILSDIFELPRKTSWWSSHVVSLTFSSMKKRF